MSGLLQQGYYFFRVALCSWREYISLGNYGIYICKELGDFRLLFSIVSIVIMLGYKIFQVQQAFGKQLPEALYIIISKIFRECAVFPFHYIAGCGGVYTAIEHQ